MLKLLMMFFLIPALSSAAVTPATCFITAANGEKFYKHNGKTKTLGTAAAIKPCPINPLVIVYDDPRGMRLYVNPMPNSPQPCLFLTVKNRVLSTHYADVLEGGRMVCKQ